MTEEAASRNDAEDTEREYDDMRWWQEAGDVIGLKLGGWTWRLAASFWDQDGKYVALTPAMANALREVRNKLHPAAGG